MISSITTKIIDNEINANLNLSIIKYIIKAVYIKVINFMKYILAHFCQR